MCYLKSLDEKRIAPINVFLLVCNRDDKIVSRLLVFSHVMYTKLLTLCWLHLSPCFPEPAISVIWVGLITIGYSTAHVLPAFSTDHKPI